MDVKKRWWLFFAFIGITSLFTIPIIVEITSPAIDSLVNSTPLEYGWSIPLVVFWDLVISLCGLYILYIGTSEIFTKLNDSYLESGIWPWRRRIYWVDVLRVDKKYQIADLSFSLSAKKITAKPTNIKIVGRYDTIQMNLNFYINNQELLDQIEHQINKARNLD